MTAPEASERTSWTTKELQEDFEVKGFHMGLCVVRRKSDGQVGSLQFCDAPRTYHSFVPDVR